MNTKTVGTDLRLEGGGQKTFAHNFLGITLSYQKDTILYISISCDFQYLLN